MTNSSGEMADKKYSSYLEKLNSQQRKAVESIEGPVMVAAGPGSGKTQVVALRIAAILQKTQMSPGNILALTFTDSGATALRQRLTELIGPLAYQVTISTFHSFANEVIGTFSHIFAVTRELTQLDELERMLIVERILKKDSSFQLLRPLRGETHHVKSIVSAIQICKREAITPEQITDFAEGLQKKFDSLTKAARIKSERQSAVLKEFSKIFEQYQATLKEQLRYDYEDMILMVLDALSENSEVKAHFQERYQYILVDEYQDTNNAQNKLVEHLADFFEEPNLFVVGDDKQAIYRFQGASVANMLHFHKRYPQLKTISLQQNYRSTPEILTAADALISNNRVGLSTELKEIESKLIANLPSGDMPELLVLTTPVAEKLGVINIIKKLNKQGVAYDQIAVLVLRNDEVADWRETLEKIDLPVAGLQSSDLTREPEARLLISILQSVVRPTDDVAFTAYLTAVLSSSEIIALVELAALARKNKYSIIKQAQIEKLFIKEVDQLLEWHQLQSKLPLVELVERIVYNSDLLSRVRSRPNSLSGLELFSALISKLRDFAQKNQSAGLSDWLDYLRLHKDYDVKFSVQKSQAEIGGVAVSTVHQAKGLEYDAVILPNTTDKNWRVKASRTTVKVPQELIGESVEDDAQIEDLRRLFYVAVTRAKKYLYLSYPAVDDRGKDQLPSQLVVEMKSSLKEIKPLHKTEELEGFISTQLSPTSDEVFSLAALKFIREKFINSAFSFTHYWDYKTCPRTYLLRHIYRFPTPFTPSLAYGSAAHKALELFAKDYRALKKLPSKQKLIEYFQEALLRGIPFGAREVFAAKGIDLLNTYYADKLTDREPPISAEYNFSPHKVMLEDIWLTGKIDLIEVIDPTTKAVRVIDYKTGREARSRNFIEGNTADSDGKIKKQLVFYALICQKDPLFPYQAKEFEIRYVDDEKKFTDISFKISQDEIDELAEDIKKTYQEILAQVNFPIGDPKSEIAQLFPLSFED